MANTFVQIGSTITVGSGGAASMDFTSIPSTYTDLKVALSVRTDRVLANDYLKITINSGSSYSGIQLAGNGASASSATFAGIFATQYAGEINGNTSTASTFSSVDIYLPNYLSSTAKPYSVDSAMEQNATTAYLTLDAGLWSGTSAITSLTFAPGVGTNFVQYTTATLYGISKS
jgi:hypothetical protein